MASAAWERRNAAARAKGYASYYDYRAHGFGRIPADQPRARGDALRVLRGHASTADFERLLHSGRVELVNVVQTGPQRYELLVITSDGKQRSFTVRGRKQVERLQATLRRPEAGGPEGPAIVGSPKSVAAMRAELEGEAEQFEDPNAAGTTSDFSDDDIPF